MQEPVGTSLWNCDFCDGCSLVPLDPWSLHEANPLLLIISDYVGKAENLLSVESTCSFGEDKNISICKYAWKTNAIQEGGLDKGRAVVQQSVKLEQEENISSFFH
jgi:hypothetical protein